ncbi:MAG: UPF0182 family protein [Acidobacteria bacterium]|nr:UPF0182 family protein [Acidobacteriota bacterium]
MTGNPPESGEPGVAKLDPELGFETRPTIPPPRYLWPFFSLCVWFLYIFFVLAALPDYFVQFWFNQSLGYMSIFWTNIQMQLLLFGSLGAAMALAIYLPLRFYAVSPTLKRSAIHLSIWIGTLAGWLFAQNYQQFLLALHGVPFETTDPVFAKDIGFYVYALPAWRITLTALEILILFSGIALLVARYDALSSRGFLHKRDWNLWRKLSLFASPYLIVLVGSFGGIAAFHTYLNRYGLLLKDNEASGVRRGAEYLDLIGLFSSLNNVYLMAIVEIALTLAVGTILFRLNKRYGWLVRQPEVHDAEKSKLKAPSLSVPVRMGIAFLALELGFYVCLVLKDHVLVSPNEPSIQKEYIERHINATLNAYRLENIEVHEWVPPLHPLPSEVLLASQTIQNAPFLPSWVSYLEEPPDIQHFERIQIAESTMVFGPMLQIYQQQQQLRPYYDFMSVDGVRYQVDGEKRMFVSAVRELPSLALIGPQEWLRHWGSAALLFTHGMGLVMSPANQIDEVGAPQYVVKDVPPRTSHPAFEHEPRIYFGEGMRDDYVLTNIRYLKEFDFATQEGRQEFIYPENLKDGIAVDSLFRRLVFALYTKDITAFLFSRYIDEDQTRVHIRRTPMSRARNIAPFLFLDTNSYAFIADKKVLWMINGLTTSSEYPYSFPEVLGDKADERAAEKFPERVINYAEDSVKITVDAYSGEIHFYKITDDPIIETWARVYPDLFEPASTMPESVRAQLTYPLQWFHLQFDDIYKRYHQLDPIEFYNVEDLWDDADETLGSIGRGLSGFGTKDQMTFSYEGYNVLLDPTDLPAGIDVGEPGELQYVMLMPFTPEGARNLRSLIIAFHDPENYGRLISLQIPQGMFVAGPEQVDAYIDNDRPVHQQVTMWIRHATEVIRGSTLLLPVAGDLLYLETIWVSSLQNELPQLKLFAIWYHDRITSGATLEEALRKQRVPAQDQLN